MGLGTPVPLIRDTKIKFTFGSGSKRIRREWKAKDIEEYGGQWKPGAF